MLLFLGVCLYSNEIERKGVDLGGYVNGGESERSWRETIFTICCVKKICFQLKYSFSINKNNSAKYQYQTIL